MRASAGSSAVFLPGVGVVAMAGLAAGGRGVSVGAGLGIAAVGLGGRWAAGLGVGRFGAAEGTLDGGEAHAASSNKQKNDNMRVGISRNHSRF